MSRISILAILLLTSIPRPATAQLDPLLFLKRLPPNVLIAVETANRMQRDANGDYRDDNVYTVQGGSATDWEAALGVTPGATQYRRKYIGLAHRDPATSGGDRFEADHIEVVSNVDTGFSTFDAHTRINIAKKSLVAAVTANSSVARFGLLRTRQSSPRFETLSGGDYATKWNINEGPVKIIGTGLLAAGQSFYSESGGGKFRITRPVVNAANGSLTSTVLPLVKADVAGANTSVLSILGLATGVTNSLIPAGRDAKDYVDAPVDNMLDDLKAEAARLLGAADCRNTVAILVVGGGEGESTAENPATKAATFLNVTGGHRVPIYVIAITPTASDVAQLQAIATNSGGQYTEITAAMIAAAGVGNAVPEFVRAVNFAVQHTFTSTADFDTAPTVALPIGPSTEHQTTSPIVGTVNLVNAKDITGAALPLTTVTTPTGAPVPQRSNVMVTTGFSLPGFYGKLRAFRVYKPEADSTKPSGYKFKQDGTRLWEASAPAAASRNIYTALPDGTMIAFTTANAASLQPYMGGLTVSETTTVIDYVRSQPLGAIVDSTPALMDPPSLDPPPDADYPGFAAANKDRRAMIWVGANDGMLHGIDARLGKEVWAFIPFNLLPKMKALRNGQPVGDFVFTVDGSPKVADVKVGGAWRTYLIMGEGPGGTFYQTFDVTLDNMASTVAPTSDTVADVLSYFSTASSVPLKWTFPRYSVFDTTILPYGELNSSATAVEKSVGDSWSDPAVGQIETGASPYTVLTGSGFFKYSVQQSARGGAVAGTTFYLLDAATGAVLDSKNVGSDGTAETVDSCSTAGNCMQIKNALQADPVATGPSDSRYITKVYLGDLDGKIWRFDLGLDSGGAPKIKSTLNLYTISTGGGSVAAAHPIFSSMATVNVGGTQQYLFVGTGSDLLPSTGVSVNYGLFVVLDSGTSGSRTALISLEKTDGSAGDEKVTSFPAVAGDIVFFSTTTYKPTVTCGSSVDGSLYAFTFIGGAAYDTTGDGTISTKGGSADSQKVRTTSGVRASSPFIVDQHLVFGAGDKVELFGDPNDFNNGVGQVGVRILSWREVR